MEYFIILSSGIKSPITNAKPFSYKDISLFTHEESDGWRVSEASTGQNIIDKAKTEADAISHAKFEIDKYGDKHIKMLISRAIISTLPSKEMEMFA